MDLSCGLEYMKVAPWDPLGRQIRWVWKDFDTFGGVEGVAFWGVVSGGGRWNDGGGLN
jgi:hypothetical protein